MEEPIAVREEWNLEYGRCIKSIWERAGQTQQEFADLCGKGVSTSTLNVIKRGESLSEEAHEKIVYALNQLALQRGDLPIDGDYLKGLWQGELKGKPGRKPLGSNAATAPSHTPRHGYSMAMWVALGLSLLLNLWLVMRSFEGQPKAFLKSWPELVPVPAGTFMMGLDNSTERNGPRTQMTLTYDLHGNVAEWCADGAAPRLPGGTHTNRFIVPKDGFYARAYRGGSHYSHPGLSLVAHRAWRDYADSGAGFRVVLAPPLERLAATSSGAPVDASRQE